MGEGSEAEDGDLLSPQISCLDQLPYGKILGNFSTDNENRKENLKVSQALCWAFITHTVSMGLTTMEQQIISVSFYR